MLLLYAAYKFVVSMSIVNKWPTVKHDNESGDLTINRYSLRSMWRVKYKEGFYPIGLEKSFIISINRKARAHNQVERCVYIMIRY